MLLSEINGRNVEDIPEAIHGIEVDTYSPRPADGLKYAGIVIKVNNQGEIDLDTMDVMLSYINHGIVVLMEIPFRTNVKANEIFPVARSLGVDISLIPPLASCADSEFEEYCDALEEYTGRWMTDKENKSQLYPASGFWSYLIGDAMGVERTTITDDPYFHDNFVEPVSEKNMDYLKDRLRDYVESYFGGRDGFLKEVYASVSMSICLSNSSEKKDKH